MESGGWPPDGEGTRTLRSGGGDPRDTRAAGPLRLAGHRDEWGTADRGRAHEVSRASTGRAPGWKTGLPCRPYQGRIHLPGRSIQDEGDGHARGNPAPSWTGSDGWARACTG